MLRKYSLQICASLSGALTTFTTGQLMGWASPSIPYLLQTNSTIIEGGITGDQASWIASLIMVGNVLGIIVIAIIADIIGRKKAILLSTIPIFVSWMILYGARRVELIYLARVMAGFGETIGKTTMFMYVGEIASPVIRGALGTFLIITINAGILFEYALGPFISYPNLALCSALIPTLLFCSFIFMPESPYYLLLHGQINKARDTLERLRYSADVSDELEEIETTIEKRLSKINELKLLFSNANNRRRLFIMCVLFAMQECCGITPTIMYAEKILEETNIIDPDILPIIFPFVKIIATLITTALVDNTGRRPLFIISSLCIGLSMSALSIYFYIQDMNLMDVSHVRWLPVLFLTIYNFSFIIGVGTLPFIMIGELFPTNIKSVAVSITAMCSPIAGVIIIKLFQIFRDYIGRYFAFGFFAVVAYLGLVFVSLYLPETKRKSLAQILENN